MELPTISIVTPSFNQAQYLGRAIRSVLDQGYPNLEYVVLDGGSTDGSDAIIQSFADRLTFWRSAPDSGQAAAVNEGWTMTTGEILGWINSDDYLLPGTLTFVGAWFAENANTAWMYGSCRVDGPEGARGFIGRPFDRSSLARGGQPMPQQSTFIRRSLFDRIGPVDESLRYSMDYDLYVRASRAAVPTFVDRPLAVFTVQPNAKTQRSRAAARQETFEVARRYASHSDAVLVRMLAIRAKVFHLLPSWLISEIDRHRSSPLNRRSI